MAPPLAKKHAKAEASLAGPPPDVRVRSPSRGRQPSTAPQAGPPGHSSSGEPMTLAKILRDPARSPPRQIVPNIDLPGNAYLVFSEYDQPMALTLRPKVGNTTGRPHPIQINSYPVTALPAKIVYQYDVTIGRGNEKRALIKLAWNSKAVQTRLGPGWIFDGNKIAWSLVNHEKKRDVTVDFDQERGTTPRPRAEPNTTTVSLIKSKEVNLAALRAYVEGTMDFDNSVLESINFVDHLLRETPSRNLVAIKRSFFFDTPGGRELLGGGAQAQKGVYQSLRVAHPGRLVINVDVANTAFWMENTLTNIVAAMLVGKGAHNIKEIAARCRAAPRTLGGPPLPTPTFVALKKFKKVKFIVKHRGDMESKKQYTVLDISQKDAREATFMVTDPTTKIERSISVMDYFRTKYNIRIPNPELPVIKSKMGKRDVYLPMDVCYVVKDQRYLHKLSGEQTAVMIKFAVTKPEARLRAINQGLDALNWAADKFHTNYGLRINRNMITTTARILEPPKVQFKGSTVEPKYGGRWDLKNRVFLEGNKIPLKSWGVCIMNSQSYCTKAEAELFIKAFIKAYEGHGGKVVNKSPVIITGEANEAKSVTNLYNAAGNQVQARPQIMIFMLGQKDVEQYERIKKSADCRYGVVSQCVQIAHVKKVQPQYISNVLMKFNAKLGGTTCRAIGMPKQESKGAFGHFKVPTVIIGADVSHASPGSLQASMAAMTMSADKISARYIAACQTNGLRVEMISTANIEEMIRPMLMNWMMEYNGGQLPRHIYYFRDGVSEGQFQHVLQQELRDIKAVIKSMNNDKIPNTLFTVIVASKRHHIRFFPKPGFGADKNGNPVPGTLVEEDITHPREFDFYLNSHSAIQGTARPTHYHVLVNESPCTTSEIQNMIYEHCYQYMRSTTPVSLFPAVYYAHLASNRARSHENRPHSDGPHRSDEVAKQAQQQSTTSSDKLPTEYLTLLKMDESNRIAFSMWYI